MTVLDIVGSVSGCRVRRPPNVLVHSGRVFVKGEAGNTGESQAPLMNRTRRGTAGEATHGSMKVAVAINEAERRLVIQLDCLTKVVPVLRFCVAPRARWCNA